jgi:hypothetical protein
VGAVAAVTALVVVAATDAGGPWRSRLGMTAALAPLCGALGTFAATRVAEARGELRALAAVGVAPWRAVLGALAGGTAVGLLGPVLAATGVADLSALFPRAAARIWRVDAAAGTLVEVTLGLRVGPHGRLTLEAPSAAGGGLPAGATGWAIVALAVAALASPAWAVLPSGSTARRVGAGGLVVGAAIVAFHAVAAGKLPPATLAAAPLVLGIEVARAVAASITRR